MVGRKKKALICEQGSNQGWQEDMISQFPDHLICHILYHLPTENAVRTSLLSTRWRNLWKWIPGLDLDSCRFSNFNALASFADRFFDVHMELRKFRLMIHRLDDDNDSPCVILWIGAALTKHRVQHLEVRFKALVQIPLSLYTCETLVHLRLFRAKLFNAEFVSLPCLKIMHLERVSCPNVATLERVISSSPVLEDLKISECEFSDNTEALQVRSRTVKRIDIDQHAQVVIDDAPLLQFLRIMVYVTKVTKSFRIIHLCVSAKLHVYVSCCWFDPCNLSQRSVIRDILTDISRVSDLSITSDTSKVLYGYSKVEPLPQFACVSRLCVTDIEWLPTFLESFPNLKSLTLVWYYNSRKKPWFEESDQISFSSVPECLLSSLEFVDIKTRIWEDATEMKLARYFLDNSVILKKLTLRLHPHQTKDDIFKELLRIPRRSTTCQVLVP